MTARKQAAMWTMQSGQRIRLCDMTDSHLLNTIRMLERYAAACRSRDLQGNMWLADTLNGEQAILCAEGHVATLADEAFDEAEYYCPPLYKNMLEEAIRRGVTP